MRGPGFCGSGSRSRALWRRAADAQGAHMGPRKNAPVRTMSFGSIMAVRCMLSQSNLKELDADFEFAKTCCLKTANLPSKKTVRTFPKVSAEHRSSLLGFEFFQRVILSFFFLSNFPNVSPNFMGPFSRALGKGR